MASATIQKQNLVRYQLLEDKEDEIKEVLSAILENPDWEKEKIMREVLYCYNTILHIDNEQDKIINSVDSLAAYIAKINYESNGVLKRYDVTGNYKEESKNIYSVPERKQILLFEEVAEYGK